MSAPRLDEVDSQEQRRGDGSGDPLIGRLLDGRYSIERFVARGGMATVYQATDIRLQRRVAVKVMHPAMAQDAEFVARFDREARSAAAIDHPGVVSVTDQGNDDGVVFLVMEYVAGRTLRHVLTERGRVSPIDALRVMEPLLDALGAAHEAGFVHRDIKPENVLLADDGRVKVTDFGLARAVESTPITTDAGMLLGTVAYLAPEQVSRGIADARSDVYACGVLLYELLTGDAPHVATTPLAVAYKHVNDDVPAPSLVVAGIPQAFDDIVKAATSRDPDARPENGHAMLAMLRRARPAIMASATVTNSTTLLDLRDSPTTMTHIPGLAHRASESDTGAYAVADAGFLSRLWWRYRRNVVAWTSILLALALVAGAGWWLGSGRYATTPNLLGLSPSAASAAAERDGLKVSTTPELAYSENVAAGLVADQKPGVGKHIKRHGTITLTISRGPLRYVVPPVQGKTLEDARNAIVAAHLKVGSTSEAYNDTIVAGRVAMTNPPIGSRVKDGTSISIVVSKGPTPTDVPNVVGKKSKDATASLTDAGFKVTIAHAFSDSVDRDRVISQSASGQAPRGSTITITVSDGPEVVEVPDLTGMSTAEARDALTAKGLRTEVVNIPGSDDVVVSQSPRPGRKVTAGSTVTIYVR